MDDKEHKEKMWARQREIDGLMVRNVKLEAENKELINDYDRAVRKFDTCRASIAMAVKNLGGDPDDTSETTEDEPWHVFLIRELERLLKAKLR